MVGSLGRLGVLVEVAFKVFPAPPAWGTLVAEAPGPRRGARGGAARAGRRARHRGARPRAARPRADPARRSARRRSSRGSSGCAARSRLPAEKLLGAEDADAVGRAGRLAWAPPEAALVRLALSPRRAARARPARSRGAARRYTRRRRCGWVAWPPDRPLEELDALLRDAGAGGVRLTGPPGTGAARRARAAARSPTACGARSTPTAASPAPRAASCRCARRRSPDAARDPGRRARPQGRGDGGRDRQLRALRLLPADLPDLRHRRRGAALAARAGSS